MNLTLRLARLLPPSVRANWLRRRYARQILHSAFRSAEPEIALLPDLIRPGDTVMDVGANVGHYTLAFSDLVGPAGRVIAIEPVPATFALLAANAVWFPYQNVSLLNLAASDSPGHLALTIPSWPGGLPNPYRARVDAAAGALPVLGLPLSTIPCPTRLTLIKIDVEGFELHVLDGLMPHIHSTLPALIIETEQPEVGARLAGLGYVSARSPGSPNTVYTVSGVHGRE